MVYISLCVTAPFFLFLKKLFYYSKNTDHEIYPINKCLSVQQIIVDSKYNVKQHISRACSSFLTETLCLL